MLDHHLQRSIVYRLAITRALRFSELKPEDVESKLFTYHLKKVVAAGYVKKGGDGSYSLTQEGRRLGTRVMESPQQLIDKADSVLFLVIRRRSDNAWLLYRRKAHPLIDRVGFMHAKPLLELNAPDAAKLACQELTGLDCEFKVLGSGYFRVFEGDELESFTHFTLLVCNDAHGELSPTDQLAGYFWQQQPDFSADDMLPNMQILSNLYQEHKPFFIERTLNTNKL